MIRRLLLTFLISRSCFATSEIGYIRGQVYSDGATVHPAPHAIVTLYSRATGEPIASVEADNDGRFLFKRPLLDLYSVEVDWIGATWKDQTTPEGLIAWTGARMWTWFDLEVE